ncbi:hypothetical protein [uncultured Draconibacterium sp.]|uniref:hypothetical protein n=1 Tax=uncultured Draconibacterium sp. TaxID=1573823 RepID=UPI0025CFD34C|nr:hypothetical protein [uncultured Draconibacterium sp.]
MKKTTHLSGIIIKHEKLIQITLNTPENIYIAEATNPYANYYGRTPRKATPNSIFLFTKRFHFLEEIMNMAVGIEKCLLERINIASALIESGGKQFAAIRIKNFPDYSQLIKLQKCLTAQGIIFLDKVTLEEEVKAIINKHFVLTELEEQFYIDQLEDHKGYFITDQPLSSSAFEKKIKQIRNNGNCRLFDAVQGKTIIDGKIHELIRIFSEKIDIELLKCLRTEFYRL